MVYLVTVPPALFGQITATMTTYRLDFDDAYQYAARRQIDGELVRFDTDFDRSDVQRLTPAMVVARLLPPESPPV